MSDNIIDTVDKVRGLIELIETTQPQPPFIFIDLEGVNLSRHGSVAIMQVLIPPLQKVHLVDVHTLQGLAFETRSTSSRGLNLKEVLESDRFPKVFFDVRNDSDALYSHYHISLAGVVDLQLLEFATRRVRGRFVKGLTKCIAESDVLGYAEARRWREVKEAGQRLFAPERGGQYEVFLERPLDAAIAEYCAQDVLFMPKLLVGYAGKLSAEMGSRVQNEAVRRVRLSQSAGYNGVGKHMAIGPDLSSEGPATFAIIRFPMEIVCSSELGRYCTFADPGAVLEPSSSEAARDTEDSDALG